MIERHEVPLVHHVDEKNDSYAGIEDKDKSIDVSACATATLGFSHLVFSRNSSSLHHQYASSVYKIPPTAIVHCDVASNLTWLNGGRASTIDQLRCTSVGHKLLIGIGE